MHKDLILVGKQGSGKGTQAKIIAKKFGFKIFETGAALRAIAKQDTDLGREVLDITSRGDLVSNDIVMRIVEDFLNNLKEDVPVIFDGIPRSEIQRESLEELLKKNSREFIVLEIKLSNQEALHRLIIRAKCDDCGNNFGSEDDICPKCGSENISRRNDDNPDAIMNRLNNFDEYTLPLLDKWKESNKLLSVNGERDVSKVTEEIFAVLEI
jgi:adenylate kinase